MQVEETIIGAMTALVTPFKNGKLDLETYENLIQRQINYGIDVIVPVGTTGESATLSHQEHRECIEVTLNVAKKNRLNGKNIKVLAGAGSNSTQEAIELAKFAQASGADGILCVTPYYNKPTQEGLYQHYKSVAESISIPLMLYNVPSRTGVSLENTTILRLFRDVKNIYGVKEAGGNLEKVMDLNVNQKDLVIVSGDDVINYPILCCGGKGVISVTSNLLPDKIAALTHSVLSDLNYQKAYILSNELYRINKALFVESNPIPIKAAMYLSGLLKTLEYRLPLVSPSVENLKYLEQILMQYEVVK
ncbi:4-hydroxy-tetrahydrodipicolinate synthase [Helicobacter canadensis]|uniref:4-hydroxy-tetrahydrodipicolinate synthase n=1 Tax=Helicobacter canadensis MIT 98-5491 TaxID=537970 RepID=C5ZYB2_9HELI|nr:4-hydroxy-tetrahydrodipicolinate synthase [Helicobacter canadensis]EES90130.1 dihydrodipicolinate synthase [Helicobacter canadensis MIT 98-5491]EFR49284.1 dihydrodipicolinate synthase [Helicobacter canadensis MIT 98-5491]STP02365.1 dihydrodipicolinate synthase [Helicobacter canadensis]